jgi:hypothetical protein
MRHPTWAWVLFLTLPLTAAAQIHVERDSTGQIVITNKGAKTVSGGSGSSSGHISPSAGKPLPPLSAQDKESIRSKLKNACAQNGLDYSLVSALVRAESDFRPNVLSNKGAIGLMQLMPDTARRFGCSNPWDLDQNIQGGTAYLKFLKDTFNNDIPLMLAGYNAGENAVLKYSNKIPPYSETVRYVFTILHEYGSPYLVEKAKKQLATPGDYDSYYVARRSYRPTMRVFYMFFNSKGVRTICDTQPVGVNYTQIVYKDDWY